MSSTEGMERVRRFRIAAVDACVCTKVPRQALGKSGPDIAVIWGSASALGSVKRDVSRCGDMAKQREIHSALVSAVSVFDKKEKRLLAQTFLSTNIRLDVYNNCAALVLQTRSRTFVSCRNDVKLAEFTNGHRLVRDITQKETEQS